MCCADIDRASKAKAAVAGNFDLSAVSSKLTTTCTDVCARHGVHFRPDHNRATVTIVECVCAERHVAQQGIACIDEVRIASLPATSHTNLTTTQRAIGLQRGTSQGEVRRSQGDAPPSLTIGSVKT